MNGYKGLDLVTHRTLDLVAVIKIHRNDRLFLHCCSDEAILFRLDGLLGLSRRLFRGSVIILHGLPLALFCRRSAGGRGSGGSRGNVANICFFLDFGVVQTV
jgi:hypothetical protein